MPARAHREGVPTAGQCQQPLQQPQGSASSQGSPRCGKGMPGAARSLFSCTSALSIPHGTFAVNHFLFRLTAEGL